jgi:small-conductance mechanosensitive channel
MIRQQRREGCMLRMRRGRPAPRDAAEAAVVAEARRRAVAEVLQLGRRADFRRAAVGAVLFLAAAGTVPALGGVRSPHLTHRIAAFAVTAVAAVSGLLATRSAANELGRLVALRAGRGAAGVLRLVATLGGYLVVLATVAALLTFPVSRLLLSGAITGVIVGIAAQQSLSNAFAGLVVLFSRPFAVGDYITLRNGGMGGQYDGEVLAIGLMYTTLLTTEGPIMLPNSGVVASATGVRTPPDPEAEPGPDDAPPLGTA